MAENFNHFSDIAEKLPDILGKVVRKTAFDIQAKAQTMAPVATGFLRNSIYTVTDEKSTYGRGVSVAKAPKAGKKGYVSRGQLKSFVKRRANQRQQEAMLLAEVAGPDGPTTAYVAVGAQYGVYVEFGTTHMPARPYFYPAVESARYGFDEALSAIESQLG